MESGALRMEAPPSTSPRHRSRPKMPLIRDIVASAANAFAAFTMSVIFGLSDTGRHRESVRPLLQLAQRAGIPLPPSINTDLALAMFVPAAIVFSFTAVRPKAGGESILFFAVLLGQSIWLQAGMTAAEYCLVYLPWTASVAIALGTMWKSSVELRRIIRIHSPFRTCGRNTASIIRALHSKFRDVLITFRELFLHLHSVYSGFDLGWKRSISDSQWGHQFEPTPWIPTGCYASLSDTRFKLGQTLRSPYEASRLAEGDSLLQVPYDELEAEVGFIAEEQPKVGPRFPLQRFGFIETLKLQELDDAVGSIISHINLLALAQLLSSMSSIYIVTGIRIFYPGTESSHRFHARRLMRDLVDTPRPYRRIRRYRWYRSYIRDALQGYEEYNGGERMPFVFAYSLHEVRFSPSHGIMIREFQASQDVLKDLVETKGLTRQDVVKDLVETKGSTSQDPVGGE